ncbi:putative WD repeat, SAM and U-box domain-containing protein [Sesbania bispinosa]|nr:putative WD repeat, SAM and U-box domain-containing protein [Sesbania bispinosa]
MAAVNPVTTEAEEGERRPLGAAGEGERRVWPRWWLQDGCARSGGGAVERDDHYTERRRRPHNGENEQWLARDDRVQWRERRTEGVGRGEGQSALSHGGAAAP